MQKRRQQILLAKVRKIHISSSFWHYYWQARKDVTAFLLAGNESNQSFMGGITGRWVKVSLLF